MLFSNVLRPTSKRESVTSLASASSSSSSHSLPNVAQPFNVEGGDKGEERARSSPENASIEDGTLVEDEDELIAAVNAAGGNAVVPPSAPPPPQRRVLHGSSSAGNLSTASSVGTLAELVGPSLGSGNGSGPAKFGASSSEEAHLPPGIIIPANNTHASLGSAEGEETAEDLGLSLFAGLGGVGSGTGGRLQPHQQHQHQLNLQQQHNGTQHNQQQLGINLNNHSQQHHFYHHQQQHSQQAPPFDPALFGGASQQQGAGGGFGASLLFGTGFGATPPSQHQHHAHPSLRFAPGAGADTNIPASSSHQASQGLNLNAPAFFSSTGGSGLDLTVIPTSLPSGSSTAAAPRFGVPATPHQYHGMSSAAMGTQLWATKEFLDALMTRIFHLEAENAELKRVAATSNAVVGAGRSATSPAPLQQDQQAELGSATQASSASSSSTPSTVTSSSATLSSGAASPPPSSSSVAPPPLGKKGTGSTREALMAGDDWKASFERACGEVERLEVDLERLEREHKNCGYLQGLLAICE
ncbi:hypothetical protein HK101_003665 [Irineochytrium annulatum]|nr:hypothetical protein HK101_003665 [Irineochytrium annulatum]